MLSNKLVDAVDFSEIYRVERCSSMAARYGTPFATLSLIRFGLGINRPNGFLSAHNSAVDTLFVAFFPEKRGLSESPNPGAPHA